MAPGEASARSCAAPQSSARRSLSPVAEGCAYQSQSSASSSASPAQDATRDSTSDATSSSVIRRPRGATGASPGSRLLAVLRLNVVQRCLSAGVLAPLVTYFLWKSPAFGTTTVCSFVTSTCSFEYACLANRIRLRLLAQLEAKDGELFDRPERAPQPLSATSSPHQTGSGSGSSSEASAGLQDRLEAQRSTNNLRSRASVDLTLRSSATAEDREARAAEEERYLAQVDSELRDQEQLLQVCAVSDVAQSWFGGRVWLAAGVISLAVCAATSAAMLTLAEYIPQLSQTEFYESRWFYSIATSYVTSLCACLSPDVPYAVIVYAQNIIFTVLTMHSTICPINNFHCGQSLTPATVFALGTMALSLFRFATCRHRVEALLNFMLDALGFLYIIGSLSVIVAFVDDDNRSLYRKLLIALLYVVWASDSGAYVTGKALAYFQYPHYNPLAAHLSKNKDYEGTLGAIAFGMGAMVVASDLLDVPGTTGTKVLFTVFAVVVGRLGDLFESLLKRAAGVKDSGTLIPGHGGVLDRIDALMFAALVFARYYALAVNGM